MSEAKDLTLMLFTPRWFALMNEAKAPALVSLPSMWYKSMELDEEPAVFEFAAEKGNLDLMKHRYVTVAVLKKTLERACLAAAANGHTDALAWLAKKLGVTDFSAVRARCLEVARTSGHLGIEKWITENEL